ncbi:PHD finger protein 7-like [Ochlerotatus camptorhynchus]|uniref:PHD finger protein 7-like n=1 Tax=Ochlerotatus camptorhynchus TaxID=644619 RepID=UPI0031D9CAD2
MEYAEDLLEDQDYPYSGLDRVLFLSCQRCFRYTPFLIYLPANEQSSGTSTRLHASSTEPLVCCTECLPENLTTQYPSVANRLISNKDFLRLIQGFEYSNPFYRRYAQIHRTLITADTRLDVNATEFENLPLYERLLKLQEVFPTIHLMQNKRYSGLGEITETLAARDEIIRNHYLLMKQPMKCTPPPCTTASTRLITKHLASSSAASVSSPSVPVVMQTARLRLLSSEEEVPCDVCLLSEKNTIQFGPFIEKPTARSVVRCHYFCLLSGTHIRQRGSSDSVGVLRFLLSDVKQAFVHYREKLCYCCDQNSAPIKCNASDCNRYFHYICGFRKGCLTQFAGEYLSYCHEHLPIDQELRHLPNQLCWICWEQLQAYNPVSSFHSICQPDESSENPKVEYSWYHRDCLQKYAYEAGYYFKCPHCHEKDDFPNYARMRGIFVPMRDASWEIDRTYFKDLHGCSCSAKNCQYANSKKDKGQMVGCKACGGETLHLKCAEIEDPDDYVCSKCMDATFIKLF